jgi:hypothetical protein
MMQLDEWTETPMRARRLGKTASLVITLGILAATVLFGHTTDGSAASADVITKPVVSRPVATGHSGWAQLEWTATPGSGGDILSYVITAHDLVNTSIELDVTKSADSVGTPSDSRYAFTGLDARHTYWFSVTAIDANGPGDPSPGTAMVRVPLASPFLNSGDCVRRQYANLLGVRNPSAADVARWSKVIDVYGSTCAYIAQQFWLSDGFQNVLPPVTRLYQAYFLRIPDSAGHAYWVAKVRAGTKLSSVSAFFAGSAEFIDTYGSLTNAQFVDKVYQNVLGRAADGDGATYWLRLLNAKRIDRGSLMLLFSESEEYRTDQNPRIKAYLLYLELLRRSPTEAEVLQATPDLPNPIPSELFPDYANDRLLVSIDRIMSTVEYRGLVFAPAD